MTRYIDLTDRAKGRVQLSAIRKTDWNAELARIEKAAAEAKAQPMSNERRRARILKELRRDYAHALRMQQWAETGLPVNMNEEG